MAEKVAIIMVGGLAKRMYPLTRDKTKNMVKLGDYYIVDYQLQMLKNFDRIIFTYSEYMNRKKYTQIEYLKQYIATQYPKRNIQFFESQSENNAKRVYELLLLENISEFLLLCCDVLTNVCLDDLYTIKSNTILCVSQKSKYNFIDFDEDYNVIKCTEKPTLDSIN